MIIPKGVELQFEEFCKNCSHADIETDVIYVDNFNESSTLTLVTCRNIDGCRHAYKEGKEEGLETV